MSLQPLWHEKVSKQLKDQHFDKEDVLALKKEGYNTVVLVGGMGTGKSTVLKQMVGMEGCLPDERVCALTSRQILARFFAKQYDLKTYQDIKGSLFEEKRVVVQLESSWRLKSKEFKELPTIDILLLDEIESLLYHFQSSTLNRRRTEAFAILRHLVRTAKVVYVADAFFSDRSLKFLEGCGRKVSILWNKWDGHRGVRCINYKAKREWGKRLLEDIDKGKRLAILSNCNDELKEIYHDKLKNKVDAHKVLLLNSECDDREKKKAAECNENWQELQYLLASPTLGAGVDFTLEHFEKMYVFASPNSCPPRELIQMMGRIRNLVDGEIHLFCQKGNFPLLPEDPHEIEVMLLNREKILLHEHGCTEWHFNQEVRLCEDGKYRMGFVPGDPYMQLYIDNLLEGFKGKNQFLKQLQACFELYGGLWEEVEEGRMGEGEGKLEEKAEAEFPKATATQRKRRLSELAEVEVGPSKLDELRTKRMKTYEDKLKLTRLEIESFCQPQRQFGGELKITEEFLERFFPRQPQEGFRQQELFEAAFLSHIEDVRTKEEKNTKSHPAHAPKVDQKVEVLHQMLELLGWDLKSGPPDRTQSFEFRASDLVQAKRSKKKQEEDPQKVRKLKDLQYLLGDKDMFAMNWFDQDPRLGYEQVNKAGDLIAAIANRVEVVLKTFGLVFGKRDNKSKQKLTVDTREMVGEMFVSTKDERIRINNVSYSLDVEWLLDRWQLAMQRRPKCFQCKRNGSTIPSFLPVIQQRMTMAIIQPPFEEVISLIL